MFSVIINIRMNIKSIFRRLPLFLEIVFSILALASENYWLFLVAGAAAAYDGAVYYTKKKK